MPSTDTLLGRMLFARFKNWYSVHTLGDSPTWDAGPADYDRFTTEARRLPPLKEWERGIVTELNTRLDGAQDQRSPAGSGARKAVRADVIPPRVDKAR